MTALLWILGLGAVFAGLWWLIRVWKPWDEPPQEPTKRDPRNPPKTFGRGGK